MGGGANFPPMWERPGGGRVSPPPKKKCASIPGVSPHPPPGRDVPPPPKKKTGPDERPIEAFKELDEENIIRLTSEFNEWWEKEA